MTQRCYDSRQDIAPILAGGTRNRGRTWARYGLRLVLLLGWSMVLALPAGCLRETIPSTSIDTVYNPELVKDCTLKSTGTYEAIGEKNALTMARNAVAQKGGNVMLVMTMNKSDWLSTTVEAKIYLCDRRR